MFTDRFIHRPVMATSLNVLLFVIGLAALLTLPIREYPETRSTVVTITTPYSGAAADLVQGFVTQPLQQAIASVPGVDYLTSSSTLGVSTIVATMKLNQSPDAAVANVVAQIQSVRWQLPRDIQDPSIKVSTGSSVSIAYVAFTSETMSRNQITDYLQRAVQPVLATVAGVGTVNLYGSQNFAMRIWLDPQRMALYGLTASDIQNALQANNRQTAAGQIRGYFNLFNVDARTSLTSPEEFRGLVVATRSDGLVRLRDVATVELGPQSRDVSGYANGRPAILVAIDPLPAANPLDVADGVRRVLPDVQRNLPSGLTMTLIADTTVPIRISIEEVVKTLEEAVVIVIIVIFLFIGSLRAVVIPIVAIPLSVVGVCAVLAALGFSVNLLTLLAMVLAIGLVVDDAIVVVENVERHMAEGKSAIEAAVVGTREIAVPVISMTITLAAVYAPIAFQGGLTGTLFREFALTLAGAVFVSGFVALTLSPMLCAKLLKRHARPSRMQAAIERALGAMQAGYLRALRDLLDHRPVVVVFALIVVGALPVLFMASRSELAPFEDTGLILAQSTGPVDGNIDYLDSTITQVMGRLQALPETANTFAFTGVPQANQSIAGTSLRDWGERQRTQNQVLAELQRELFGVVGLRAVPFQSAPLPGAGGGLPFQFVVTTTSDYQTLNAAVTTLMEEARRTGLFAFLDVDLKFESPTMTVRVNRDKAGAYGVTMDQIGSALQTMMSNGYTNFIGIDGRSYQVIPQAPRAFRLTPSSIDGFYVRAANGDMVPLHNLVDVTIAAQPQFLLQFNQINSATISGAIFPNVALGTAIEAVREAADRVLPQGFSYDFTGASRQYVTEGGSLTRTFVLALVIIFLVLAAQFESFRDPLVIMVSVPLATCGALIPLALWVTTLNIYSQVGLITLVGLITKHGILICEVAKEEQEKHGRSRREAVEAAAALRLRPILMTTAAMVAGLIPLLFASGPGAQSRFAIGITIVAGLSIGTLFTLFVLP
ncbi:MAG: efflux RND transporter permease subunit, partial [Alphaproteobacteria bacterium]|nr:efflux RND transporter permease subunit [Alphaproteobacteria bacterium]